MYGCCGCALENCLTAPCPFHPITRPTLSPTPFQGVMLRRTQDDVQQQLQLPPCSRIDLPVTLSHIERTYYEQVRGIVGGVWVRRSVSGWGGVGKASVEVV